MAFTTIELTGTEWTLIANSPNVTFFNVGGWPMYVNFSASATPPAEPVGLLYQRWTGETKAAISSLTFVAAPTHVFARAISNNTKVVVETV